MKPNLIFLPIPICIIIFAIIAYVAGAWMFFSSLIASFGILLLFGIEVEFIDFSDNRTFIKLYKSKGKMAVKKAILPKMTGIIICNIICLILSFFPFAFMSESFSRLFHLWEPYEGGILVFLITLFNLMGSGVLLARAIYNTINLEKGISYIEKNINKERIKNQRIEESNIRRKNLVDSILPTDKVITIGKTLFALSTANNKVIIGERIFNLSDIISFSISDNSQQIFTPSTSRTKTNTGSVIGRAVVGGVLTGGVGAIIGGATAKKETVTEGGTTFTTHDYSVHLSMDNISEPLLTIHIGSNSVEMEQAKALFNVIIKRNSQL